MLSDCIKNLKYKRQKMITTKQLRAPSATPSTTPNAINLEQFTIEACRGVPMVSAKHLIDTAGISVKEQNVLIHNLSTTQTIQLIITARTLAEQTPQYGTVAARLLLTSLTAEVHQSLATGDIAQNNRSSRHPCQT